MFSGSERYEFEHRRILVRKDEILTVAPNRSYGSAIRSAEETESFSLIFPDGSNMPSRGMPAMASSTSSMPACQHLAWQRSVGCRRRCGAWRWRWTRATTRWQRSSISPEVEAAVFAGGVELGPALHRIVVRYPARRAELLRRVPPARDQLPASLAGELSLTDLAEVAHLSDFHLLRTFRQASGVTPARYRLRLRMELAYRLATYTH